MPRLRSHPSARFGRLLACATLAVAPQVALLGERFELTAADQAPIELTAPRAQPALVAGTSAELAWRPAAGFDALADATEWEAFLSVDGGRTFAVRLTPHLDLARRHFAFEVPDLPSEDVRLLLRIGDERDEREYRPAARFSIVRPTSPAPVALADTFASADRPLAAPGEPATASAAGVLFWVEGGRDGSNLRQRRAVPAGAHSASRPALSPGGPEAVAGDDGDGAHSATRLAVSTHPASERPAPARIALAAPTTAPDILLLIQRQNE